MKYEISAEDRKILRETAKKQMDFACQERNKILKEKWYLHNALRGETPMVVLEVPFLDRKSTRLNSSHH